MDQTVIKLTQNDGYVTRLFYYETSNDTPLGTVLILHGMAEHHKRYLDFIQALTNEGFDVYTYDHRGHGTDKKLSDLGFIAKKNGAAILVEDARTVCDYIKEHGRSKKLAVFGHSMGSLTLRCLLQSYEEMDCAIISSSTMPPRLISWFGSFLAGALCRFQGPKRPSAFLQKAMFGGKAYTSLCTRTSYDWLTRNNTIIGRYIDDPYCGFLCTTSFYRDLAQLAFRSADKHAINKTRKNIPVLFLAGDKDPVGGNATQILRLHKIFSSLGFTNAELKVYPESRHELLNELNSEEVYRDIMTFLHKTLQ